MTPAHDSSAPFDLTTEKTLAGTIRQFDWTNPANGRELAFAGQPVER